jgi:hypothetical protein
MVAMQGPTVNRFGLSTETTGTVKVGWCQGTPGGMVLPCRGGCVGGQVCVATACA